jgi:hypothetical protein
MIRSCVMEKNNSWLPFVEYPQLKKEWLSIVAEIIRNARLEALRLYAPLKGDDSWCHGCRAFAWSKFALIEASKVYPWLTVPEQDGLRVTFAIDGMPFRFYRGEPNDPPSRYLGKTFAEIRQLQMAFSAGFEGLLRPVGKFFRVAVETNAAGEPTDISLIEMDNAGNVTNSYAIPPVEAKSNNVVTAQVAAVDLPAPSLPPLPKEEQQAQDKTKTKKKNG